ncbi:helix-turn-helix transcriptional regulator, partial [Gottfriedia acidiceleris]
MDYGMMIFHHRKKLGWTQEKLCEGICSVSHLSKIENGTKEAGIETIELLLRKMRVELDENDSIDEVTVQLKRLWNSIERADYDSSKILFEELIGKEESINYTNISNDFCITIWRYYIFVEDLKMAKKKWKQLEAKKKKFSQYETIKYLFTLSIYYIKEKRYNDSLLVMDEVQEITPNLEIDFQEYCFYRALVYSFINQTSLSMYFCNKAIPIFLQNNNIKRILDAKMLLSLQLIKSKFLDRAEQFLIEILDSSVILSDKTIHMSALHNLGYLYYHSNQHKKAIK